MPPEAVAWELQGATSLFEAPPVADARATARVSRALLNLLESAACHRDEDRWALMYRVLWRVVEGGEPRLMSDAADPDISRLRLMAKAVSREVHHMHAFVRFREAPGEDGEPLYAAWFEPEHHILERAAPFFRDRFASMRWMIATPEGAAIWDRKKLAFVDGPLSRPTGGADDTEALWRTYYANIYNPARLNPTAMRQHMPARFWKNLPEAEDIQRLARQPMAGGEPNDAPRWSERVHVPAAPLGELQSCRRCPLWEHATQAVAGEGPAGATILFVGEQPGDEEDLKGRPFVGPAGQVFDRALAAAAIDRRLVYITNAVKHFKWEPRGKRRIHKTPAQREVEACHAWLDAEIAKVAPRVIVALGATAALALTGGKQPIASLRGQPMEHGSGAALVVTYHPSAVLRSQDQGRVFYEALCEDLTRAASLASGPPSPDAKA